MEQYKNKYWDENRDVKITVLTPTYNRKDTLLRTIRSIENQDFLDWEYIIVNDGSTDNTDEVVEQFMQTTKHPVLYIKKENGGVHTARNLGYKNAHGELLINLDSDDEMLPDALKIIWSVWKKIPKQEKTKYREIVAQSMDEQGARVGEPFPKDINRMPWDKARRACYKSGGEHVGCFVTNVMKENLFPEPEGVTFMTENILWRKLDGNYCSYYINDMVQIYHQDGSDHLSSGLSAGHKKTIQNCKNALWESTQFLNDWKTYQDGGSYVKELLRYCIMNHILRQDATQQKFRKGCALKGVKNKCLFYLMWFPSIPAAKLYQKKKMKR